MFPGAGVSWHAVIRGPWEIMLSRMKPVKFLHYLFSQDILKQNGDGYWNLNESQKFLLLRTSDP